MMLMLASPFSSIQSKYSSSYEPGIRFALELTDSIPEFPSYEDKDTIKSEDMEHCSSLAESSLDSGNSSRFFRSSTQANAFHDPFTTQSIPRMSPSDHQDRLRSRMPPELHTASRGLPRSIPSDHMRPLSFAPSTAPIVHDPVPYAGRESTLYSSSDDRGYHARRQSQDSYIYQSESPTNHSYTEYEVETNSRRSSDLGRNPSRYNTRRRPFNQDEFDGPSQLLPLPIPQQELARSQDLPTLPVHLNIQEQEEVIQRANDILAQCAYHFVAKYQFPIPLERDKPRVRGPSDREWTEWAYLLKRLATKRRIPARVLFDNQIKQFVTTLENSIAARQGRDQQTRASRDDRYILQLISAGTQVAKILMDSQAMEQLDALYRRTEAALLERRARASTGGFQ